MREKECFYLDANSQPAHHMLRKCVGQEGDLDYPCKSGFTGNQLLQTNLILERGSISNNVPIRETTTEGFTTDNGLGESSIPMGQCPEGYKRCPKTGKCFQVCVNCKYRDGYKSQYMNEYDPCFPEGVYNGRTTTGSIKCTCGQNNQYCDYIPKVKQQRKGSMYTSDGAMLVNNQMNPTIGNPKHAQNLFLFETL